jgi:hypothetical protein
MARRDTARFVFSPESRNYFDGVVHYSTVELFVREPVFEV